MRIAVTGASGLIGGALVPHLRAQGHEVVRLVRRPSGAPDEVTWDPMGGTVDVAGLVGVDAVIHLAGAGVGDHRWTDEYKATIRDSRAWAPPHWPPPWPRWISLPRSSSPARRSGSTGTPATPKWTRAYPRGRGFLADVVVGWEAAAQPARDAGIRVVHPRTGLVVAGRGGAWAKLWPLFRLGAGGRMGTGRQWWSFISLRDELAALTFLLDALEGPVNLTAPNPVTNAEMVTEPWAGSSSDPPSCPCRRRRCRSPSASSPRRSWGAFASVPTRLLEAGFEFQDPTIDQALAYAWASR